MKYSGGDLVRHFLKRCLHALMQYKMSYEHVKSAAVFSVVLEALPRVSTLTINGSSDHRTPFPVPNLKQILAAASNNLASLTIHVGRLQDVKKGISSFPAILDIAARPRHINLRKLETDDFNVGDLSWIWRACGQVEELEVSRLSDDAILSVIFGIRGSMPLLNTVTLGKIFGSCGGFEIDDVYIRAILETGTKGLEAVHYAARTRMGY
ncbi:hypothetical protein CPB97_010683 [Podila verticillata]|nr:hypothetical protein CPB97_010683 [Podila verticillata]